MTIVLFSVGFCFLLLSVFEFFFSGKDRRYYIDVFVSASAFLLSILMGALFGIADLQALLPRESTMPTFLSDQPVWIQFAFALIMQDFLYYWMHRCEHRCAFLWSSHYTHHSSPYFNAFVSLRSSLFQCAYFPIFMAPMLFIGIPFSLVMTALLVGKLYSLFTHFSRCPSLGRHINLVFVTPHNHRFHHAQNAACIDKNFGGILIIWDVIFCTHVFEQKNIVYGVGDSEKYTFHRGLFGGVMELARQIKQKRGFMGKLGALL